MLTSMALVPKFLDKDGSVHTAWIDGPQRNTMAI